MIWLNTFINIAYIITTNSHSYLQAITTKLQLLIHIFAIFHLCHSSG